MAWEWKKKKWFSTDCGSEENQDLLQKVLIYRGLWTYAYEYQMPTVNICWLKLFELVLETAYVTWFEKS